MNPKIISAVSGYAVGIIAYWFVPYNHYYIFGCNIYVLMSLGCFLASLVLKMKLQLKPTTVSLWVSLGFMVAIITRIFYDISFWDKTSHNLFPFELILYSIIIIPSVFAGSFLANLIFPRK